MHFTLVYCGELGFENIEINVSNIDVIFNLSSKVFKSRNFFVHVSAICQYISICLFLLEEVGWKITIIKVLKNLVVVVVSAGAAVEKKLS